MYSIIKDTFKQSLDRWIFWILALGCTLFIAVSFCLRLTAEGRLYFVVWELKNLGELLGGPGRSGAVKQSVDAFFSLIQSLIVPEILGWLGIIISVVATADFVPSMLEKGGIDLLLARPLGRARIFVAKFIGGCTFVASLAAYIIVGSFLGFGLMSGYWNFGYLGSIVVLVFLFAIVYSVSVLAAVLTRSTIFAILASLGFWFFCNAMGGVRTFLHMEYEKEVPAPIMKTLDAVYTVLPKPGELDRLGDWFLNNPAFRMTVAEHETGKMTPAQQREMMQHRSNYFEQEIPLSTVVWSSAAFIVVTVGLAAWKFARTDY